MKISSLKFKEITNIVKAKNLKLNLFEDCDTFLVNNDRNSQIKTNKHYGKINQSIFARTGSARSRPKSSRDRNAYRNWNYINQTNKNNQSMTQDCFFFLQKSLIDYIQFISIDERKSIRKEMELLSAVLGMTSFQEINKKLVQLQKELSKTFKNRLIHLAFYLIYNKLLSLASQRNVKRQIKHFIFCEYYSRKFNFKQLTLAICIEIQQMYRTINIYQESRHYARKSLRLAVVLGNQYEQSKMIEILSMLNYYEGRLNQFGSRLLSQQQRKRILQTYSQENQLPKIFNCNPGSFGQKSKDDYQQFAIEHSNNFIENCIPSQNFKYFNANYHQIVKAIPGKNVNVRGIISKVNSVGLVKKYFGRDNYITIRPQCHIIKPTHQEQVLITHKKDGGARLKQESLKKVVKRILGLLQYTMQAYSYRL